VIDYHGLRLSAATASTLSIYEPEECALALTLFDEHDRVLVAGAGLGLVAACIASTGALVVAVEAQYPLVRLVRENVSAARSPMLVLHGALSTVHDVRTTIGVPEGEDWALARVGLGDEPVSTLGIEHLLARFQLNALALDVEGAEVALVDCALRLVEKALIEVHHFVIGHDGNAQLRQSIREAGHRVERDVARDARVSWLVTKRAHAAQGSRAPSPAEGEGTR
jgi:FkbM family methyltransferase